MKKFVDIESLKYDSIDTIIKRFEEYKKLYGGETIFICDIHEEDAGYGQTYTSIYQGFRVEEK